MTNLHSKYKAELHCGYCKKITPIEDKNVKFLLESGFGEGTICSCSHFSYCSSIRLKVNIDVKDWKKDLWRHR